MSSIEKDLAVLVVDDEEEFLASASRLLGRRGFEVVVAGNGREALEIVARRAVDLAVVDLKMPEMDGEELVRRLRGVQPELPVVILTGHGSIPHAFQMSKSGVADYVAKPCDMELLARRIREVVREQRASLRARPTPRGGAPRVLLVDDEAEFLDAMARALSRRHLEVETASDGAEALLVLGSREVDVVVLDVRMPGMDGLELLQEIQRTAPDRRVIVLSGHPAAPDAVTALRHGAMEYLIKPPDVERLADLIERGAAERRSDLEQQRERLVRSTLDRHPE